MTRPRKPRRSLPHVGTSEDGSPYPAGHPEYIGPHFVAYHGVTPRSLDVHIFVVTGTLGGEAIWQPKDGTLYFPPIQAATARSAALHWLADQIEELYNQDATDGEIAVVHAGMLRLAAEMGLAIPARPKPPPAWVEDVYALASEGSTDGAIDAILGNIDTVLDSGQYRQCDEILCSIDSGRLDIASLLAVLSVTKRAAPHLAAREEFARRARAYLERRAPDRVDRLLAGLV